MDKEDREENELWGSGEHERLLRSLIVDVQSAPQEFFIRMHAVCFSYHTLP